MERIRSDRTPAGRHYVRSHFPIPAATERLDIDGHGKRPLALSPHELRALRSRTTVLKLDGVGSNDMVFAAGNINYGGTLELVNISGSPLAAGIAEAVSSKTVVGVSPLIAGTPVRGMADACLAAIGVQSTAAAVAAHYGPALLDGWLVDTADASAVDAPELAGIAVRAIPLYMTDVAATAAIARSAIDLAQELSR